MAINSLKQRQTVMDSFKRTTQKLEYSSCGGSPIVYISGAMTGHKDFNYPEFGKWAAHFRKLNFGVFNPAENFEGRTDLPYEEHLLEDVIQVLFCTHIFMLPGWQDSKGAYMEYLLARRLNLIFVDETGLR